MHNINTVEYWNKRFDEKTGDWNIYSGEKQSQILLRNIECIIKY